MPESVQSCFELSIHFPFFFFFPRTIFSSSSRLTGSLYRQMYGKFIVSSCTFLFKNLLVQGNILSRTLYFLPHFVS